MPQMFEQVLGYVIADLLPIVFTVKVYYELGGRSAFGVKAAELAKQKTFQATALLYLAAGEQLSLAIVYNLYKSPSSWCFTEVA